MLLLFLGGVYLYISSSMIKVVIPERVSGVPETACWHGGPDGGVWINVDTTNIINQFNIQCYFDSTGELWGKGTFVLDSLSEACVFSGQDLQEHISCYNGYGFSFSREMYREHPKVILRKLKN